MKCTHDTEIMAEAESEGESEESEVEWEDVEPLANVSEGKGFHTLSTLLSCILW